MDKLTDALPCPNCLLPVDGHPENGCVLATFIQVIRERGNLSEKQLRELHHNTDVKALWSRLGPILDDLEEGVFEIAEPATPTNFVGYATSIEPNPGS